MSQNTFGQPSPFGAPAGGGPAGPAPEPEVEEQGGRRTKLLIAGGAGLAAIVLAGAAALVLTSGGDDAADLVVAAPKPAAAATPSPTETSAPLPTTVEFAGRNPFKAKIVEGAGGGAGGGAATDPAAGAGTGTTGGTSGGIGGSTGGTIVGIPGPRGPEGPAGPEGPQGEPGADGEMLLPFLAVTFTGMTPTDDPENPGEAMFVLDVGALEEVELTLQPEETFGSEEPLSWVKYLGTEATAEDGTVTKVRIQLGDAMYVLTKDRARTVYKLADLF